MARPGMHLLSDPTAAAKAFTDTCDWCERFSFCTPAADSDLDTWSTWRTIVRNASKLRHAIVALEDLRSEPHALEWLQGQEALRLIPAADGSFRPNVYRFERGDSVRVILGAGRLARPGLMAPFDSAVLWEGSTFDPFAAEIDSMLEKARALAHVPTQQELDEYSCVFFQGAPLREELVVLGAPFIRSTARDAEMPELELVVEGRAIRQAMRAVRDQLMSSATESRRQAVGFPGGNLTTTIHWVAPLKMWSFFQKLDNRYWNCFGTARPDKDKTIAITVEVNPRLEGVNRQVGGAYGRDPTTGDVYLLHRGRIGGGQKGVGTELFWNRFRGGAWMKEPGRDDGARVVIVGKVGAPSFVRDVAAFVHEVGRIKAAL